MQRVIGKSERHVCGKNFLSAPNMFNCPRALRRLSNGKPEAAKVSPRKFQECLLTAPKKQCEHKRDLQRGQFFTILPLVQTIKILRPSLTLAVRAVWGLTLPLGKVSHNTISLKECLFPVVLLDLFIYQQNQSVINWQN